MINVSSNYVDHGMSVYKKGNCWYIHGFGGLVGAFGGFIPFDFWISCGF